MSTEKTKRKSQRVWLLYVVGLSLMGAGFYFAFTAGTDETQAARVVPRGAAPDIDQVPSDLDRSASVTLELKTSGPKTRLVVEQSQMTKDAAGSTTTLELVLNDAPAGALEFERSYTDVKVRTEEGGKALGGEIPAHVVELLGTVKHRVAFEPNGRVKTYALTSSQSGQLGPLLNVLKDAMQMLSPQFPREAVNVDEPWSYRAPYDLSSESGDVSIKGDYQISSTYRGTTTREGRRVAVVEQNLTGKGEGAMKLETGPMTFTTHGVGHAVFYVDLEAGAVVQAGLVFEQVSALSNGAGMQTTSRMQLEALK